MYISYMAVTGWLDRCWMGMVCLWYWGLRGIWEGWDDYLEWFYGVGWGLWKLWGIFWKVFIR